MMIDAKKLPTHEPITGDICIVGAGAAGITMAVELANSPVRIVLVESGGPSFSRKIQELSRGEVVAQPYHLPLHLACRRIIGGTTTVWGGRCVPLDEIDFERRDYLSYSGWPISRDELLPYFERANRFCEVGAFGYSVAESLGPEAGDMVPGFRSAAVQIDNIERFSCPTNFGRRYWCVLRNTPNLTLIYHATCTGVKLHPDGKIVESLVLKTVAGRTFEVRAKRFVLAMGCLETTRLLLASSDVSVSGIGNHSGRLGRFYMCHIEAMLGELRFSPRVGKVIYGYEQTRDGVYCQRRLAIQGETQKHHRIGNLIARLYRPVVVDPRHGDGILSAIFLTKQLLLPKYASSFTANERRRQKELKRCRHAVTFHHMRNIIVDIPRLLWFSRLWLHKRILARRKLPPIVLKSRNNSYPLEINAEQSPDRDNRVVLINRRDRLGVPEIRVYWRMNEFDKHTIKTSLNIIGHEFRRSRCGDLWLGDHSVDEQIETCTPIAGHHIGTARMASAPADGVVDENCCVHGIDNLFVSGSAVFPTSGHANPTLTIVALAMRLADHLKVQSH